MKRREDRISEGSEARPKTIRKEEKDRKDLKRREVRRGDKKKG